MWEHARGAKKVAARKRSERKESERMRERERERERERKGGRERERKSRNAVYDRAPFSRRIARCRGKARRDYFKPELTAFVARSEKQKQRCANKSR